MADYQELRERHVAYLAGIFPEWVQRLCWPAERLRQERQRRLRELLRVALASSPWHRERLGGIDAETFVEEDLPLLPAMTKDDLMAYWDAVVPDRRLTLELVERHLAGLTADAYLVDEVHACASGGSTGHGGVRPRLEGVGRGVRRLHAARAVGPGGEPGARRPAEHRRLRRRPARHPHDQLDGADVRQPRWSRPSASPSPSRSTGSWPGSTPTSR
jgi:hypothetical protein